MVSKQNLFEEIQAHLLKDNAPSDYLNHISSEKMFAEYPFSKLNQLKDVAQSPTHHPEGSVWNHTMMVIDEAAKNRVKSSNTKAFMWAALLHDIGKADTTKNHKGKITSYNHEKVGADQAEDFLREFMNDEELIRRIVSLIRWHMQILFVIKSMQFADIESMLKETELEEIALLGFCDRMGRSNADKNAEIENLKRFKQKCKLH